MRSFRSLRVANLIQEELSRILVRDFDFEGALVTIKSVRVLSDLSEAEVGLGVIPFEKEPKIFIMITARRKELQGKLLRKINIKPMPTLKFKIEQDKD